MSGYNSFLCACFAAIGCFDFGKDQKCGLCALSKVNEHFKGVFIMCCKVLSEFFLFSLGELNFLSDTVLLFVVAKSSTSLGFFMSKFDAARTESFKNAV